MAVCVSVWGRVCVGCMACLRTGLRVSAQALHVRSPGLALGISALRVRECAFLRRMCAFFTHVFFWVCLHGAECRSACDTGCVHLLSVWAHMGPYSPAVGICVRPEYLVFLCVECVLEPVCDMYICVCAGSVCRPVCVCALGGCESGCMAFAGLCVTVSLCVSVWCVSVPACGVCPCVCSGMPAGLQVQDVCVSVCVILFGVCLWVVVSLGVSYIYIHIYIHI